MDNKLVKTWRVAALAVLAGFAGSGVHEARADSILKKLKKQGDKLQQEAQNIPVIGSMPGVNWAGTYVCVNGQDSAIRLHMETPGGSAVQAIAYVYPSYIKGGANGSYELQGNFDWDSGKLDLAPVRWIQQLPPSYVMVGFRGVLQPGSDTIEGTVSHGTCRTFKVSHIPGTPVGLAVAAMVNPTGAAAQTGSVNNPASPSSQGSGIGTSGEGRASGSPQNAHLERFDVAGVRLGMSIDEAKEALRRFNPALQFRDTFGSLERVDGSRFLGFTEVTTTNDPKWKAREKFRIDFAPPPHEGKVIAITRHVEYREGSRPTVDSTIAALDRKYGTPNGHNENFKSRERIYAFAENGTTIAQDLAGCRNQVPASVDATRDVFFNIMPSRICGLVLSVSTYSDANGGGGPAADQLLILLDEVLVNAAVIRDMRGDTDDYIRQKVRDQAKSVAAPSL